MKTLSPLLFALGLTACSDPASATFEDEGSTDSDLPSPGCGNAIVEEELGEACDMGSLNGDHRSCRSDCQWQSCGDGHLGPQEECDDGNEIETDVCLNDCRLAVHELWRYREAPSGPSVVYQLNSLHLRDDEVLALHTDISLGHLSVFDPFSRSHSKIMAFTADGEPSWELPIVSKEDVFVGAVAMTLDEEERIVVAGFLWEPGVSVGVPWARGYEKDGSVAWEWSTQNERPRTDYAMEILAISGGRFLVPIDKTVVVLNADGSEDTRIDRELTLLKRHDEELQAVNFSLDPPQLNFERLDADLEAEWSVPLLDADEFSDRVALEISHMFDHDGNALLSLALGTVDEEGLLDPSSYELGLRKFDPDGELLWERDFSGNGNEGVGGLTLGPKGEIVLGLATTSSTLCEAYSCIPHYSVLAMDSEGEDLWRYAPAADESVLSEGKFSPSGDFFTLGSYAEFVSPIQFEIKRLEVRR